MHFNSVDSVHEEQRSNAHSCHQSSYLNFDTQSHKACSSDNAKCALTTNSQAVMHDFGDSRECGVGTEVHDLDNFSCSEAFIKSEVLWFQQCNGSYQIGSSFPCITTFLQLKHRKCGNIQVISLRRNRFNDALQPETANQLYPNGQYLSSGALGIASTVFHESERKVPPSFPYIYEDLYPRQGLELHVFNSQVQAQKAVPFTHLALNHFSYRRLYFSPDLYFTDPGLLSFLTMVDQNSHHPIQLVHANRVVDCRSIRISITEEVSGLEEQLMDTNTALSEEIILKNLRKSMHLKLDSLLQYCDPCVICQLDFNEGDRLGILNCGHKYHSCCITRWLLIRNLCPICKKPALRRR